MPTFKERLQEGVPLLGTLASLGSVESVELLSHLDLDFIWIDAEHSAIGVPEIQSMVRAVAGRCAAVVRVPSHDEAWIKKVLDTGCDGIVVPQVNSAPEAERIVECCYYPPKGRRSVGGTRAQSYGLKSPEYFHGANDSIGVIVQVEHADGVHAIEEIVNVKGIDNVFIGPIDLSASLGVMGQFGHPEVMGAINRVREVCNRCQVSTGIYARDAEAVKAAMASGVTMVAFGSDTSHLRAGISQALAAVR